MEEKDIEELEEAAGAEAEDIGAEEIPAEEGQAAEDRGIAVPESDGDGDLSYLYEPEEGPADETMDAIEEAVLNGTFSASAEGTEEAEKTIAVWADEEAAEKTVAVWPDEEEAKKTAVFEYGYESGSDNEYTVSTQNFYEQYGAEIREYLSGHEEEDPIEEYEAYEEENRDEDEEPPKPKKKRKKKHYLLKFAIFCGCVAVVIAFMMSSYFDIQKIDVEGTSLLKKSEVVKMSGVKEGENIFKLHKKDVKANLQKSPYIAQAEVEKDLPGTVTITVLERNESAAVKYGKEYLVIDPKGYVLRTTKKLPKLTLLSDMKIRDITVGEKLDVVDEEKFSEGLELIKSMKKTEVYFKKIEFGKKNVRAYVYDKLVCKGSYENVKKSLEDGSLETVVRDLYKRKIKKGTIKIEGGRFISYSPEI